MDTQTTNQEAKVEILDVPINKESPSKMRQKAVDERRQEILKVIKRIGLKKARQMIPRWAQQYEVAERQIYHDIDWLKGHYRPVDLREVRMEIDIAMNRMLEEAIYLLHSAESNSDKQKAISAVATALKTFREELEGWGIKEEVAKKITFIKPEDHEVDNIHELIFWNKNHPGVKPKVSKRLCDLLEQTRSEMRSREAVSIVSEIQKTIEAEIKEESKNLSQDQYFASTTIV